MLLDPGDVLAPSALYEMARMLEQAPDTRSGVLRRGSHFPTRGQAHPALQAGLVARAAAGDQLHRPAGDDSSRRRDSRSAAFGVTSVAPKSGTCSAFVARLGARAARASMSVPSGRDRARGTKRLGGGVVRRPRPRVDGSDDARVIWDVGVSRWCRSSFRTATRRRARRSACAACCTRPSYPASRAGHRRQRQHRAATCSTSTARSSATARGIIVPFDRPVQFFRRVQRRRGRGARRSAAVPEQRHRGHPAGLARRAGPLGRNGRRSAIVGAKLLYPDRTIQHAGVVFGLGLVGHIFSRAPEGTSRACSARRRRYRNYLGRHRRLPDDAAGTSSTKLGGFDERFRLSFSDVVLCMEAWKAGYRVVYTPYARLVHHESYTAEARRLGRGHRAARALSSSDTASSRIRISIPS